MSAAKASTAVFPVAAVMAAAAARVRARSRPVMATRAPSAARPAAVALPMPPVPPVTSTVLPAITPVMVSGITEPRIQSPGVLRRIPGADRTDAARARGREGLPRRIPVEGCGVPLVVGASCECPFRGAIGPCGWSGGDDGVVGGPRAARSYSGGDGGGLEALEGQVETQREFP